MSTQTVDISEKPVKGTDYTIIGRKLPMSGRIQWTLLLEGYGMTVSYGRARLVGLAKIGGGMLKSDQATVQHAKDNNLPTFKQYWGV